MTRETAKTEVCSHCKNETFLVHHLLRDAHHDRVYLQCSKCEEMTSRLIVHAQVAPNSYNSFLQKVARLGEMDPRAIIERYKTHEKKAKEQFSHVLELLKCLKDSNKVETAPIAELYNEYNIIEDDTV